MRLRIVFLLGLFLAGCEVTPSVETSRRPGDADTPRPTAHTLSFGTFASTAHEFVLADGTPCVAVHSPSGGIGVSCGWGHATSAQ